MRPWLKTIIFVMVLALGCLASFYLPDGAVVVILIGGFIMFVLGNS